jgi:hypothetical protein
MWLNIYDKNIRHRYDDVASHMTDDVTKRYIINFVEVAADVAMHL